jgi:glycosyltransferase involved in cell wall biosynthesis
MRIVQLIDTLHCGGAEQVVANLAKGMTCGGHEVIVLCLRDMSNPALAAGARVTALEKPPGAHPATARKLAALLRAERIDLINTHNHLVHHYGVAAARAAGAKVVNTLHGTATLEMAPAARLLYWAGCRLSDAVVSVCGPVQATLMRRYWLNRRTLTVIPNGISLDPFTAIPPRAPRDEVVFGSVGRLVDVKDHATLLRAFAMLHGRHPRTRLRLLGGGPLEGPLKNLAAELGIVPAVDFCGFSNDVADFLATLDVFVLPSKSEGLPITLLEAFAAALPAVATEVGGVPDVIRPGAGLMAAPGDAPGLAARMEAMLTADRGGMGASARREALARFSMQAMVAAYERLYLSLIAGNGVPAAA